MKTSSSATASMTSIAAAVRQEIARLNADVPGLDVRPMTTATAWALVPGRVAGTIPAVAGLLALIVSAGGVYGIVSYATARQTRELGIRIALGATRRQVLRFAMRAGLVPIIVGSACGLGVAALAARALATLLYGLSPFDPFAFMISTLILAFAACVASYLPARRATTIDPVTALRVD